MTNKPRECGLTFTASINFKLITLLQQCIGIGRWGLGLFSWISDFQGFSFTGQDSSEMVRSVDSGSADTIKVDDKHKQTNKHNNQETRICRQRERGRVEMGKGGFEIVID